MKLESIIKQILSEQTTPNQLILKLIKNLGKKGASEAESALIRAMRKEGNLGPKVAVDVNNVTEDLMMRSVANNEFASYRKLIAQKEYNRNQQLFDDIIEKYPGGKWKNNQRIVELNNAGIPPVLQPEVKNLYGFKNKTVTPKSKTTTTTPTNLPIENLSKSEIWDYFRGEMKNLKVVNKLNPEQGKLFVDELQSSIEKNIQKNGQKFESELNKLKTQFENIKSPVDRKKLLEQTHKSIDELGLKRNLSQSTIRLYKKVMSDIEKSPVGLLQKGVMYSTIVSMALDGIRLYDDEEEFKGHLGMPFLVSGGGKIAIAYLGYVLLRYNPLGFLVSVGLTMGSIIRFGKYAIKKMTNVEPGMGPFINGSTGNNDELDGIKN